MRVKPKAALLVSAWDAVDAGRPLDNDQQRALEEWDFIQSMEGNTKSEQDLDRSVLRTVVRLSRNA